MKDKSKRKARIFVLAGILGLAAAAWAKDIVIVVQRETSIRQEKRTLSPAVAKVREGDELEKVGEEGSWLRVAYQGKEGWIATSAVSSDRKVVLSGEALASGVRATEQGAAGRGLTPEVEKQYRAGRADLDEAFKILERIQDQKFPEDRVAAFIKAGKLGEAGQTASRTNRSTSEVVTERPVPPWKR